MHKGNRNDEKQITTTKILCKAYTHYLVSYSFVFLPFFEKRRLKVTVNKRTGPAFTEYLISDFSRNEIHPLRSRQSIFFLPSALVASWIVVDIVIVNFVSSQRVLVRRGEMYLYLWHF